MMAPIMVESVGSVIALIIGIFGSLIAAFIHKLFRPSKPNISCKLGKEIEQGAKLDDLLHKKIKINNLVCLISNKGVALKDIKMELVLTFQDGTDYITNVVVNGYEYFSLRKKSSAKGKVNADLYPFPLSNRVRAIHTVTRDANGSEIFRQEHDVPLAWQIKAV